MQNNNNPLKGIFRFFMFLLLLLIGIGIGTGVTLFVIQQQTPITQDQEESNFKAALITELENNVKVFEEEGDSILVTDYLETTVYDTAYGTGELFELDASLVSQINEVYEDIYDLNSRRILFEEYATLRDYYQDLFKLSESDEHKQKAEEYAELAQAFQGIPADDLLESDIPDHMLTKIAQSDVPDNMLSLLTALKANN